jgi:hypothetical protein
MAIVLVTALSPALPAKQPARCEATEAKLLGYWHGINSFEEMAFEQDGEGNHFNSWLHHRPDRFGLHWTLVDCQLTLMNRENSAAEYRFQVKSVTRTRLLLINLDDGYLERYTRIRT